MNLTFKSVVRNLVSTLIILGLIYYLWKHWEIFNTTLDASWHHIYRLVACIFIGWILNSIQVLLLLRQFGVKIGFWENMILIIAMTLGNYLPMRIGSFLRIQYLKKVHGFQYIQFGGILAIRILILIISTGVLGCIGLIGMRLSGFPFNVYLLCVFISMVIISLGVCLIQIPKPEKSDNFLLKLWSDLLLTFEAIQSRPLLLCQVLGLALLQFVVLAIRFSITFDAVHVELSPWVLLILTPMTTLIEFLSLTPGSLGLREWAIGFISMASGIDFSNGIFAGTFDRSILMVCTFIFGIASLAYVWFRMKSFDRLARPISKQIF
jgi:uncharacterized membrane protein YbhN (UPF0104 family)